MLQGIANGMQPAEGHAEHPSKCLADFCNNAEFSDITLKAQGTIIHAHKVVLAAHSPYFKTMLQVSNLRPQLLLLFGLQSCLGDKPRT